ncbi:hypothetical protein NW762_008090 [Fusarium torreyae]|uniref:F-box domain-containing protein n=1 Tax=Fusarium torreyae TaxID=1237075 RepID=A0A9W8VFY5_9HYPO|nr:hypothetical protein NW762_008090 [Fusarium torreyae]
MASRRSSRIRGAAEKEPAVTAQPGSIEAPAKPAARPIKRKAPVKKETENKKQATASENVKKEKAAQPQSVQDDKASPLFPPEVLNMILNNIKEPKTISTLSRVCKNFYSIMAPRLHNRVVADALYHAHIQKLIRAVEPYLSIEVKKQLKKEGTYKGQQTEYPQGVDERAIPFCASQVRQLVIGDVDPGKNHQHICERYIEEGLKSMRKLEIADVSFLTEPIAQYLASLENLQALNLHLTSNRSDTHVLMQLAKVKNLKHFRVVHTDDSTVQEILMRSQSTLKTLTIYANQYNSNFLEGFREFKSGGSQGHAFTSLERLELEGVAFDGDSVKLLQKAFNLVGLREIRLRRLGSGRTLLIRHLMGLLQSSNVQKVNLKSLFLDVSRSQSSSPDNDEVSHDPCCALIASFDTLTSLELHTRRRLLDTIPGKSGMQDSLLQAILRHSALKTLKISSTKTTYDDTEKGLYLSAVTVASIVDGLPDLQEFGFAPKRKEIDEIARVLTRARKLTSVTCAPGKSYEERILTGFLSTVTDRGKFVWEEHFKLNRVIVGFTTWEVASKFGKREKRRGQLRKACSPHDQEKKVEFRENLGPGYVSDGHDPEHKWIKSIAKEEKVNFEYW